MLLSCLWKQGKIMFAPHQELHLCCFWVTKSPIQDSRFQLICTMNRFATSHNKWKWLSWCIKLIWSFGMKHRWCIVELSKLLIGPCMIWCNWMMHRQPKRSLVGKPWSLVGIFYRSYLLFPRKDKKTLLVLHCLDRIFGNMLWFLVFISTCKSWQRILKRSESLPNGCWMLEITVFLPLQKKKVLIQIRSRFRPIWGYQ